MSHSMAPRRTLQSPPLTKSGILLVFCICFFTLTFVVTSIRGPLQKVTTSRRHSHETHLNYYFDFSGWAGSLRMRAAAVWPAQTAAEVAMAAYFPLRAGLALAARFPLPEIGAVVALTDGTCLLGHCDEMVRGASTWGPDTHIRDVINSIMLPCALRWLPNDCLALDIGSNFGLHTLGMLQLGARVISVEPQTDLCVASRLSIEANGWAARSVVLCGGVAAAGDAAIDAQLNISSISNLMPPHRYQGPIAVPHYKNPVSVPLYTINRLLADLPQRTFFRLVKIDTDTIDCSVLAQVLDAVDQEKMTVGAFIFESWDMSCRAETATGRLLVRLRRAGFVIYRVHITERSWNDDHVDTKLRFAPITPMPAIFVEQFCQRFNFNVWKLIANATDEALIDIATTQTQYQYVATKDPFLLPGYVTSAQ